MAPVTDGAASFSDPAAAHASSSRAARPCQSSSSSSAPAQRSQRGLHRYRRQARVERCCSSSARVSSQDCSGETAAQAAKPSFLGARSPRSASLLSLPDLTSQPRGLYRFVVAVEIIIISTNGEMVAETTAQTILRVSKETACAAYVLNKSLEQYTAGPNMRSSEGVMTSLSYVDGTQPRNAAPSCGASRTASSQQTEDVRILQQTRSGKRDEALGNVIKPSVPSRKTDRETELVIAAAKLHIQQKMVDAKTGKSDCTVCVAMTTEAQSCASHLPQPMLGAELRPSASIPRFQLARWLHVQGGLSKAARQGRPDPGHERNHSPAACSRAGITPPLMRLDYKLLALAFQT